MDEMCDEEWSKRIFGVSTVKIDTSAFLVAGHSMGGATALMTGLKDKRVKAVLALDPWYFPIQDEIATEEAVYSKEDPPVLLIHSSTFHNKVGLLSDWEDN
jgi:pimeloyl-ACP methyl ester carboxylesterase